MWLHSDKLRENRLTRALGAPAYFSASHCLHSFFASVLSTKMRACQQFLYQMESNSHGATRAFADTDWFTHMKKLLILSVISACLFTAACTPASQPQAATTPAEASQPETSPHPNQNEADEPETEHEPVEKHQFTLTTPTATSAMENPDMEGALAFAEYYFSNVLESSLTLDTSVIATSSWPHCSACVATVLVFNSAHHPDSPTMFQSALPINAYDGQEVAPGHFVFKSDTWDMTYERHDGKFTFYRTFDDPVRGTFEVAHGPAGWRMINYMFTTVPEN